MPANKHDIIPAIQHRDKTLDLHQSFIGCQKTPSWIIVGVSMEGGKKSESVSEGRKREFRFTVYATGFPSMEVDFNSLNFFIVEQQKKRTFSLKRVGSHKS